MFSVCAGLASKHTTATGLLSLGHRRWAKRISTDQRRRPDGPQPDSDNERASLPGPTSQPWPSPQTAPHPGTARYLERRALRTKTGFRYTRAQPSKPSSATSPTSPPSQPAQPASRPKPPEKLEHQSSGAETNSKDSRAQPSPLAAILVGKYASGALRLTTDNARDLVRELRTRPEFMLGQRVPENKKHTRAPVRLLAQAIVRRGFRDPDFAFKNAGMPVLAALTRETPWLASDLSGTFFALVNRWDDFKRSGVCPKPDPGRYMFDHEPVDAATYRQRIKLGAEVLRVIAAQRILVGSEDRASMVAKRCREHVAFGL